MFNMYSKLSAETFIWFINLYVLHICGKIIFVQMFSLLIIIFYQKYFKTNFYAVKWHILGNLKYMI